MTADQLRYMLNLVYDENNKPKEFVFTCDYLGEIISFRAYIGSNVSFDTIAEGKIYKNITFNITETRRI